MRRRLGHLPAELLKGALIGLQGIDLMLREIADVEFGRAPNFARHRLERAGEQFGERRFSVAVGTE